MINSADPDLTPYSVAFDVGLYCLLGHNCPDIYGKYSKTMLQIDRTYDKHEDADLWRDGWFGSRVTRYLCVERCAPQPVSNWCHN